MFLKQENERMVNTKALSTVRFLGNKIIYNYNYHILIDTDREPSLDYTYWYVTDDEVVDYVLENLSDEFITLDDVTYVNMSQVSNIGFDERNKKVIFNHTHSAVHPLFDNKITSGFTYFKFKTDREYRDALRLLNDMI